MVEFILAIILLPLLGCLFVLASKNGENNAYNVSIFTLISNIVVVLGIFSQMDISSANLQYPISYSWTETINIEMFFGIDTFSLMLLFGVYISLLIGLVGLNYHARKDKSLLIQMLYFTFNITGLFVSADITSFYIFFSGMLLPLFMLIGMQKNIKKTLSIYRFFIYNFIASIILFIAIIFLFQLYDKSIRLDEIAFVDIPEEYRVFIWSLIFISLISRIPVWPFHYWISSISSTIKNPLVYIMVNILPLSGLYGVVQFWPKSLPQSIEIYIPYLELFCISTMIIISFIALANKDFLSKLFSYTTVYYLIFLLAVILPTNTLYMNIAYSIFIFLIVTSALTILELKMEEECTNAKCEYRGILAYMPKLSKFISFFVLVAIGLPISSLFWNNFILVSAIFSESFIIGLLVMFSMLLLSVILLQELYVMRDLQVYSENALEVNDISKGKQLFLFIMIAILLISFFNPMWFVI